MVEERTVDPKTGVPETKFKVQPFEVSIPLLAMISSPSMQLQEMKLMKYQSLCKTRGCCFIFRTSVVNKTYGDCN